MYLALEAATLIVLAEFGRYPLHFHWWQQIFRYHNCINNLPDDERLIQCAFAEGLHDQAHCFWNRKVQTWLQLQSTALNIEDEICISTSWTMPKPFINRLFTRLAVTKAGIGRCCNYSTKKMRWFLTFPH